jgi:hypothetical protein
MALYGRSQSQGVSTFYIHPLSDDACRFTKHFFLFLIDKWNGLATLWKMMKVNSILIVIFNFQKS